MFANMNGAEQILCLKKTLILQSYIKSATYYFLKKEGSILMRPFLHEQRCQGRNIFSNSGFLRIVCIDCLTTT